MTGTRRRRGFALPSAIFILVILAALGAFILNISTSQQVGAALDVQGERAYQAAYAGMEWARYQVWNNSACPANTTWNNSTSSLTFAGTQTLTAFAATVECRLLQSTDVAGVSTSVYEIRVTACNKPQAAEPKCPAADPAATTANPNPLSATLGYVERQMNGLISL
jgi:MSHA biogenesis protein MshP